MVFRGFQRFSPTIEYLDDRICGKKFYTGTGSELLKCMKIFYESLRFKLRILMLEQFTIMY